MVDRCPKCHKPRTWITQKDRHGNPMFRRVKASKEGECRHTMPHRINVSYPPDGVL